MATTRTTILYLAGGSNGGVMAIYEGKQLLSAPSRKVDHPKVMKAVLACTGSVDATQIASCRRATYDGQVALATDTVGHVDSGKEQSFGESNGPDGAPNKPLFFAGMAAASVEGNSFPSASLLSDLNSIGMRCAIGRLSMIQSQLPGGTVQATTCIERKPIQFKVPNVGVTFDPIRLSAYGAMLFDPFWESALLRHKEKAIQVHADTAYAGVWFDQFWKSTPLAAGSRELLTIQFNGAVDFMYVGEWFDPILMLSWGSGLVRAHCDSRCPSFFILCMI